MKFINSRDLRQKSGEVWKNITKEDYIVTSNGKPVAIITAADEDPEMQLKAIRQARAELAVFNMQKKAAVIGINNLSEDEINAEIAAVRRAVES